jgi:pimeloyl-ACP methyl ester carboxylesterase
VLLHGLGATADTWRLVADSLCHHQLTIAFDLRGHGLSDQPDHGYDLVTMAEDAVQGMAALGLGKVTLVGHGWGARIALILAARHPALISHLILVDCPHVEPRHWPGMTRERFIREIAPKEIYASRTSFLAAMQREMKAFWSPDVESIVLTYVRELADGSIEEHLRPENQRRIREALWDDRALSYYSKVHCPVLLVPAASKPQFGKELPERMEQAAEFAIAKGYMVSQVERTIRRCSVLWMPETGHDIQLQRPDVLAIAIEEFVKVV